MDQGDNGGDNEGDAGTDNGDETQRVREREERHDGLGKHGIKMTGRGGMK